MIHLKTILVPTDFSEHSRYALEVACGLARDQAARVILLHVLPRSAPVSGRDAPAVKEQHTQEDLQAYDEEMAALLAKVRCTAPCAQVESSVKEGDVASVIARTVEDVPCDLIVMGTHGKMRMAQLMLGSVARQVMHKAPCPVVTVNVPASAAPAAGQASATTAAVHG